MPIGIDISSFARPGLATQSQAKGNGMTISAGYVTGLLLRPTESHHRSVALLRNRISLCRKEPGADANINTAVISCRILRCEVM